MQASFVKANATTISIEEDKYLFDLYHFEVAETTFTMAIDVSLGLEEAIKTFLAKADEYIKQQIENLQYQMKDIGFAKADLGL